MPFTLDQYSQRWPFLYHLAFRHNLERIRTTSRLESAALLLTVAGHQSRIRSRRPEKWAIPVEGSRVLLRDQAPLHEANIEFTGGWTFEDLLEDLNSRVFFWPGSETGPNDYGVRHYERYAAEKPVIIRVAFDSLLERNPERRPLFKGLRRPEQSGDRSRIAGALPVRPTGDHAYPYEDAGGASARRRVRIYLPDDMRDAPVVVRSELSNIPGGLITNSAEVIAAGVIRANELPTPLVWIEHWPKESTDGGAETFDLVVFSSYEVTERAPYLGEARAWIEEPAWKPLDRSSVEVLVGAKV